MQQSDEPDPGQCCAPTPSTTILRRQYVYGGQYIDEPLIFDKDTGTDGVLDTTYYYCQQANYNVVALTDDTGTVVEKVAYDPYGEYTLTLDGSTGNPYLFQGRRWDDEADLYYFRNRDLSPAMGRFVQRDPLIYESSMNLYEFVRSTPVHERDAFGLQNWTEIGNLLRHPVDSYRANDEANKAEKAAEESGLPGSWNGFQDAYRHCMWNCLMAQRMSAARAKTFADAHEADSQRPAETEMDLHNNRIGRQLGADNPSEDCECLCREALENGQLVYLNNNNEAARPGQHPTPTAPDATPPSDRDPGEAYNPGYPGAYYVPPYNGTSSEYEYEPTYSPGSGNYNDPTPNPFDTTGPLPY